MDANDYRTGPRARSAESPGPSTWLAHLASAMHVAASEERQRINARIVETANDQVERARARTAAEARQLRRRAQDDVEDVYERCQALISRIRRDADIEIAERRQRLADTLVDHASILQSEVDHLRETVDAYQASVDTFFDRLTAEPEPEHIARMAGGVPPPPDLSAIRADARADALARIVDRDSGAGRAVLKSIVGEAGTSDEHETALIGVMEPDLVDDAVSGASPTR